MILGFQQRFEPLILAGAKQQTIRGVREHPGRPGDTLHLYVELRQPGARRGLDEREPRTGFAAMLRHFAEIIDLRAPKIDPRAVQAALAYVMGEDRLDDIGVPQIVPCSDGGLQLAWRGEIEFECYFDRQGNIENEDKVPKRLLGRVPCIARHDVGVAGTGHWFIDGHWLDAHQLKDFARLDGFADVFELHRFFEPRLPFVGHVYRWDWSKRL